MMSEEEACLTAMRYGVGAVLPMVLKTAVELDLFRLINESDTHHGISASELAAKLPTTDPGAAAAKLDRVLRLLAAHSILSCSLDGGRNRRYALSQVGKYFIKNEDGVSSCANTLMGQDKVLMESWYHLKDSILEGGNPFERAHGTSIFEYASKDGRIGSILNQCMSGNTLVYKKIFQMYKGFDGEGIQTVVDVGGGTGATLNLIVSDHPSLNGINFDLPHVIQHAPSYPRIKHVAGDMFAAVPRGDAIFMKWIMHDWSDKECLKILKNCKEAIPENGKVIIVDYILAEIPENEVGACLMEECDVVMLAYNQGAKERTETEFRALAEEAGFKEFRKICTAYAMWVIELYK